MLACVCACVWHFWHIGIYTCPKIYQFNCFWDIFACWILLGSFLVILWWSILLKKYTVWLISIYPNLSGCSLFFWPWASVIFKDKPKQWHTWWCKRRQGEQSSKSPLRYGICLGVSGLVRRYLHRIPSVKYRVFLCTKHHFCFFCWHFYILDAPSPP